MKKHILAIGLLLNTMTPALALDVGDISSFMNSDSSTLSKEIKNTTDSGRLINIHMERLSSPLDGGKVIPMDKQDEILLTPASLLLPAKASDVIRFFYKGPADDKERYYRIVWFDQALSDAQRNGSTRSAVATASARIGTILVVAPRKVNYRYQYANGTLTNTGNATLRILAYGPCLKPADGKDCKENYFLMPGKSAALRASMWLTKRTGRALAGRAVCSREIDNCADGPKLCLYQGLPQDLKCSLPLAWPSCLFRSAFPPRLTKYSKSAASLSLRPSARRCRTE